MTGSYVSAGADFTVTTISIPLCPNCLHDLEMLQRYGWAPSLAWCPGCIRLVDVIYEESSRRWVVLP